MKKYNSLNGLRTIACFGIVLMHVLSNLKLNLSGFGYERIIPSFTNFVFLFMAISAFGMCCGYYDKILNGQIDLNKFYGKRFSKTLPFFSLLVILDLVVGFSLNSLYEAIADVTLSFGLFPNNIEVIGVGWFLGLVFAFYMMFPFYCTLISSKKKAWIVFGISLVLNYLCVSYFDVGRTNIVHCMCYFMAGGLVYLYRDIIEKVKWFIALPILFASIVLYYIVGFNTYTELFFVVAIMIFAIGKGGITLDNKFFAFISGISMEIYLSHMVIFRAVEKVHLNRFISNSILLYWITAIVVIIGAIIFAFVVQKGIAWCESKLCNINKK